jgi:hypothetical protein
LQAGDEALLHPPPGTHASTKILSISKHVVGICAIALNWKVIAIDIKKKR